MTSDDGTTDSRLGAVHIGVDRVGPGCRVLVGHGRRVSVPRWGDGGGSLSQLEEESVHRIGTAGEVA
jgi:hypothetical protein